jgi:hypothetical protein
MATTSITSNDGTLPSASAVLEVTATNPEYNQPALRVKQEGTGRAASIRIDDPNPDIEFVETGLTNPGPGAGKFEIAVQADRLQINGRRAAVSPADKGFDTIVVFQRPAAGTSNSDSQKPVISAVLAKVKVRFGRAHCERRERRNLVRPRRRAHLPRFER